MYLVECHPCFQQPKLRQYCKQKGGNGLHYAAVLIFNFSFVGIVFEAYSPLGSPGRQHVKSEDPVIMEEPRVKEIAEKHGATPGQVSRHYAVSGHSSSVISSDLYFLHASSRSCNHSQVY